MSKIEFGPVMLGIYHALCWGTLIVVVLGFKVYPQNLPLILLSWIGLLLFLGFGLKPFLEKTGIHDLYLHYREVGWEWGHREHSKRRRREIDQKIRNDKHRHSRARGRDPRLPKDW